MVISQTTNLFSGTEPLGNCSGEISNPTVSRGDLYPPSASSVATSLSQMLSRSQRDIVSGNGNLAPGTCGNVGYSEDILLRYFWVQDVTVPDDFNDVALLVQPAIYQYIYDRLRCLKIQTCPSLPHLSYSANRVLALMLLFQMWMLPFSMLDVKVGTWICLSSSIFDLAEDPLSFDTGIQERDQMQSESRYKSRKTKIKSPLITRDGTRHSARTSLTWAASRGEQAG